jgi:hypothetical protein
MCGSEVASESVTHFKFALSYVASSSNGHSTMANVSITNSLYSTITAEDISYISLELGLCQDSATTITACV